MDSLMIIPAIVSFLFWPLVIGLIIYGIVRKRKQSSSSGSDKNASAHDLTLSLEDSVSQLYFLIAFLFFGVTLFALNRDLGDPAPWSFVVLLSSLVGLGGAYALKSIFVLPFSIIGIVSWWTYEILKVGQGKGFRGTAVVMILALLPVLFYVLGHFHTLQKKYVRFAMMYKVFGILMVSVILFALSTQSGIDFLATLSRGYPIFGSWQLMSSLLIMVLVTIGLGRYSLAKKRMSIYEYGAVILAVCLFAGITLLPEQHLYVNQATGMYTFTGTMNSYNAHGSLSGLGIFWAVVFNLIIFLELLGLIFSGYMRREEWLINVGALFLFLLIVAKYFDWFFTFLDKSIFFIGAGILLFALGWFMERGRRYMIANVKAGTSPHL